MGRISIDITFPTGGKFNLVIVTFGFSGSQLGWRNGLSGANIGKLISVDLTLRMVQDRKILRGQPPTICDTNLPPNTDFFDAAGQVTSDIDGICHRFTTSPIDGE